MKMKKLAVTTIALLVLTACGGGGGEGEDGGFGSSEEQCREYCDYACSKLLTCANTGYTHAYCSDECYAATQRRGTITGNDCYNAGLGIAQMTCQELFTVLGLRRVGKGVDADAGTIGSQLSEVEAFLGF